MLQLRELAVVQGSPVCLWLVVGVGYMMEQEVQEGVLALIDKLAVGVAPFAVILIEGTVGLLTDHGII